MTLRKREKLAILALVAYGVCCGCTTTHRLQLDEQRQEHDQLAGTTQLRIDESHRAQLDQHQVETAGPVEELHEILGPDGGVAERVTIRRAPRKLEAWQTASMAGEEHLQLDAGFVETHDLDAGSHLVQESKTSPSMSCAAGGYLWAIALIAVALAVLNVARKLRP